MITSRKQKLSVSRIIELGKGFGLSRVNLYNPLEEELKFFMTLTLSYTRGEARYNIDNIVIPRGDIPYSISVDKGYAAVTEIKVFPIPWIPELIIEAVGESEVIEEEKAWPQWLL